MMMLEQKAKKRKEKIRVAALNPNTFDKLIKLLDPEEKLNRKFKPYLENVMRAKECLITHDIHKEGEVTKSAYFISYGFMLAYYMTKAGELRVVGIYGPGRIVAGYGFLNGKPSKYNLMIFKGAYVLEITYDQMQAGYKEVPGMLELAMETNESLYASDLHRDEMISKTGEERVLAFYREFPLLLPAGRFIIDTYIASYLHLSVATLRRVRTDLMERNLL